MDLLQGYVPTSSIVPFPEANSAVASIKHHENVLYGDDRPNLSYQPIDRDTVDVWLFQSSLVR